VTSADSRASMSCTLPRPLVHPDHRRKPLRGPLHVRDDGRQQAFNHLLRIDGERLEDLLQFDQVAAHQHPDSFRRDVSVFMGENISLAMEQGSIAGFRSGQ